MTPTPPADPTTTDPGSASPRPDPLLHGQRRARRPHGAAPLRRSRNDRRVVGIAGGIAAFTGAPARTVRAVVLLSVPLSLGITALGYLLLWALLPLETEASG